MREIYEAKVVINLVEDLDGYAMWRVEAEMFETSGERTAFGAQSENFMHAMDSVKRRFAHHVTEQRGK